LIASLRKPVKVLGQGEISRAMKVTAHAFSHSAREKIERAGGEVSEAD
jgi:large subunit ribosomal protein L15